jgi:acyl-CoA thioesterase
LTFRDQPGGSRCDFDEDRPLLAERPALETDASPSDPFASASDNRGEMQMTHFRDLLDAARRDDGTLRVEPPEGWRQGRTVYGGLTAAIAYVAAREAVEEALSLRSAQLTFVGPVTGELHVRSSLLRRGKSSAFVEVRATSNDAPVLTGIFLFMVERPSSLILGAEAAPLAPEPDKAAAAMRGPGPAYWDRMEFRHALSAEERGPARLLRWVRLREPQDIAPVTELFLIGDALPPAVTAVSRSPVVASSATWNLHLHNESPRSRDGWWLVQSRAETALGGISSQQMQVWGHDGQSMMSGAQTVAFSN